MPSRLGWRRSIEVPMNFRRHLSFANLVSLVALFIALGGSSYAAMSGSSDEEPAADGTATGRPEGTPNEPRDEPMLEQVPIDGAAAEGDAATEDQAAPPSTGSDTFRPAAPADSHPRSEDTAPAVRAHGAPIFGGARGRRGRSVRERRDDAEGASGPPAWAPAYGRRCKDAGNAPGSAAFHGCIESSKG